MSNRSYTRTRSTAHASEKEGPAHNTIPTRSFGLQAKPNEEHAPETPDSLDHSQQFGHDLTTAPASIQAKLSIGAPGDKYEQEADQVAAQVVQKINAPQDQQAGTVQRDPAYPKQENPLQTKPLISTLQREDTPKKKDEEQVQAKSLIQREAMPEEEEETVQAKSLVQREAMPEEEEKVQAKSLIQREDSPEEEEKVQAKSLIQREAMHEEEEKVQAKSLIQREEMSEDEEETVQAKSLIQREEMPEEEEKVQAKSLIQREEMPEDEEKTVQAKSLMQREEVPEEEKKVQAKAMVQRNPDGGGMASANLESSIDSAKGKGQDLDDTTRSSMEQAFGADFSSVKVHTDAKSDQLNRSVQARAFTTGQDIFFRKGEYQPGNRNGQELLAHELTHVIQQEPKISAKSPSSQREMAPMKRIDMGMKQTLGDEKKKAVQDNQCLKRDSEKKENAVTPNTTAQVESLGLQRQNDIQRVEDKDEKPENLKHSKHRRTRNPSGQRPRNKQLDSTQERKEQVKKSNELSIKALQAKEKQNITKKTVQVGARTLNNLDKHYEKLDSQLAQAYEKHHTVLQDAKDNMETRAALLNFALGVVTGALIGPLAGGISTSLTSKFISSGLLQSSAKELGSSLLSGAAGEGLKAIGIEVGTPDIKNSFGVSNAKIRALSNVQRLNASFRKMAVSLAEDPDIAFLYEQLAASVARGDISPSAIDAEANRIERIQTALFLKALVMKRVEAKFENIETQLSQVNIPSVSDLEKDIWIIWIAQLKSPREIFVAKAEKGKMFPYNKKDAEKMADSGWPGIHYLEGEYAILDEDPIENRLHKIGVLGGKKSRLKVDFGSWTSSDDEWRAWTMAQVTLPLVKMNWARYFLD